MYNTVAIVNNVYCLLENAENGSFNHSLMCIYVYNQITTLYIFHIRIYKSPHIILFFNYFSIKLGGKFHLSRFGIMLKVTIQDYLRMLFHFFLFHKLHLCVCVSGGIFIHIFSLKQQISTFWMQCKMLRNSSLLLHKILKRYAKM